MAKTKDPTDKVVDVAEDIHVEVMKVGERLDELEKSGNPEVAEAMKLARQCTESIVWLTKLQAGLMPLPKSQKFLKMLAENGLEFLASIREAQIDFASIETRALLTKLGFYNETTTMAKGQTITQDNWTKETTPILEAAKREISNLKKHGSQETKRALTLLINRNRLFAWSPDRDDVMGGEWRESNKEMRELAIGALAELKALLM